MSYLAMREEDLRKSIDGIRAMYLDCFGVVLPDLVLQSSLERELTERHRSFFLSYTKRLSSKDLVSACRLLDADESKEEGAKLSLTPKPQGASPEVPAKAKNLKSLNGQARPKERELAK